MSNIMMGIKQKHTGFTMIEVTISLIILLIVGGLLMQGKRAMSQQLRRPNPDVEWYVMLHQFENPANKFTITSNNTIHSKNTATDFEVTFLPKSHDIRLEASRGGFMVLMTNVKSFKFDQKQNMTVTTLKGQTFKSKLLLPKAVTK